MPEITGTFFNNDKKAVYKASFFNQILIPLKRDSFFISFEFFLLFSEPVRFGSLKMSLLYVEHIDTSKYDFFVMKYSLF